MKESRRALLERDERVLQEMKPLPDGVRLAIESVPRPTNGVVLVPNLMKTVVPGVREIYHWKKTRNSLHYFVRFGFINLSLPKKIETRDEVKRGKLSILILELT